MDLPVITFIQERLAESSKDLETRAGSGFYDLFVEPQQLMLQPFITALETTLIAQSVSRILSQDNPDAFDEESVDSLASNLYVSRVQGDFARTTVRVFYVTPVDREWPAFSAEFSAVGNLSFFNEFDYSITATQMSIQTSGNYFYTDIPVRAQVEGEVYNVDAQVGITAFVNDPDAVSVTNLTKAAGGLPRETNTQLLTKTANSIGVRDLETVKGINAILRENYPSVTQIQPIGMGDPEMMRDILYNAHIGGETDVYMKFQALTTQTKIIKGLEFDSTRELANNVHIQLTATTFSDPESDLGTPFIVSPSVVVKDDFIETAAEAITGTFPMVLAATDWIRLGFDLFTPYLAPVYQVKIAGATPGATQRFEVINAINSAVGIVIAEAYGTSQIKIKSPTIGFGSNLYFYTPDSPRTDGTTTLLPSAVAAGYIPGVFPLGTPATYSGEGAIEYIENIDYEVEYDSGHIRKMPGGNIVSQGTTHSSSTGVVTISSGVFSDSTQNFDDPISNLDALVRPGDELNITSIAAPTGVSVGTYIITAVLSNTSFQVQNKYGLPTGPLATDSSVVYTIKSNQVVVIDYKYNPLSVDVGGSVLLADGLTRGIRPGRDLYTITDAAFIDVISIEEIDPDTEESLGVVLTPAGGYGSGLYGAGGYGGNVGGDYAFIVNDPTTRYSVFEDSIIVFSPSSFGKSYKITFYQAPEIPSVHTLSRNDLERVTGADVLPKSFIPAFADMTISVRRGVGSLTTPDNAGLAVLVNNYILTALSTSGLQASDISKLLEDTGLDSVKTPFDMTAEVLNPDGTSTILESQDILIFEDIPLPKYTPNFTTSRITTFFPRNVVVVDA